MQRYLITDPLLYSSSKTTFEKKLTNVYKNHQNKRISLACFRDKTFTNFEELANIFVKISKKFNIKAIINTSISTAIKSRADGVHLSFANIYQTSYAKHNNLYTICSTHSIEEVHMAYNKGADAVTYGPMFTDKYHLKQKNIDGLLELLKENIPIKVFPLGGIVSKQHIKTLKDNNINSFASIRYFFLKRLSDG